MKKLATPFLFIVLSMIDLSCQAQETETQRQERQLQEQAQRMQDSLMNTDQMKEVVNMLEEMKKVEEQPAIKKNKQVESSKVSTSHLDNLYITNSKAKKFDNWKHGAGEIMMLRPNFKGSPTEHKVGSINADGSFDFSLPETMVCEINIGEFFKCQYIKPPPETTYSHPNTGISYVQGLLIFQEGKRTGNLTLASSRQQEYNNSPYGMYRGEPGYRLEYWYTEGETSAKVGCKRLFNSDKEIQSVYDLSFKPGWNLIKIEIAESYSEQLYKTKKYSVVPSLPSDAKWVFNYIPN